MKALLEHGADIHITVSILVCVYNYVVMHTVTIEKIHPL